MTAAHPDTPEAPSERRPWRDVSRWSEGSLLGVLLLLAALPYLNTILSDFLYAYDDGAQILQNPYVHSFRYLKEIFGTTVWSHVGAQGVTNYYRPLMTLGYLLTYQVFGPLAYGFHLVNVILHLAVVGTLFLTTAPMFKNRWLALVAALAFALHPVHTESVAWIAAVTDIEVTLFFLLTFWLFLKLPEFTGGRAALAQVGMGASFVLALLAKEQALTLPLLATLYEHGFRADRKETGWKHKVSRYVPLWLVAIAYLVFRLHLLGTFAPSTQHPDLSGAEVFLSGLVLVGQYVGKLLWPVQLCAFHVFDKSTSPWSLPVLGGALALIGSGALLVGLRRRSPPAAFAVLWIFITLAPVLNARWMAVNVFSERYLYLPSVGFCWLVGAGLVALWRTAERQPLLWRAALAAAFGAVAIWSTYRIIVRNREWRNDVVLLTRTLAGSPRAYRLHSLLGLAYWREGNEAAAEREWRTVLEFNPDYASALNNLGMLAARQRRHAEATALFQRAAALEPDYVFPYLNLGLINAEQGQMAAAERYLRAAVALAPLNFEIHNVLGKVYFDTGRLVEAEEQFRQSLASEPNLAAYDHLGYIALLRNDYGRAEQLFKMALSLNAADIRVRLHWGMVCAATGRLAEAQRAYEAVLASDPKNAEALAALAKLRGAAPTAESPKHQGADHASKE